jgi:hypothetical protein
MVIHQFYVKSMSIPPSKADAPLSVHADAVLSQPVAFQGFQPVGRWYSQILQIKGVMNHLQLPLCCTQDVMWKTGNLKAVKQGLGMLVSEGFDHAASIIRFQYNPRAEEADMQLFIVESPGKVKKILSFLGPDYRVMATECPELRGNEAEQVNITFCQEGTLDRIHYSVQCPGLPQKLNTEYQLVTFSFWRQHWTKCYSPESI